MRKWGPRECEGLGQCPRWVMGAQNRPMPRSAHRCLCHMLGGTAGRLSHSTLVRVSAVGGLTGGEPCVTVFVGTWVLLVSFVRARSSHPLLRGEHSPAPLPSSSFRFQITWTPVHAEIQVSLPCGTVLTEGFTCFQNSGLH